MAKIEVGAEVIYRGYDSKFKDERTKVLEITRLNGAELALVRLGGRSYRVYVDELKSVEDDETERLIATLRARVSELEGRYARLEEALQLIADGKADNWIDSRTKYTRWISYPGGLEIIRQVATMVLRDIDEPDVTDFWNKPREAK